ncbi:MAG: hypothetical protein HC822_06190 [Oscillochloris sp.]|nr:hypothetical protein [Oscillochloris sp.]
MNEPFYGLATHSITNGHVQLDVLSTAGPRIVRLIGANGRNLLAEMPDKTWDVPNGTFHIYGGHRLWHGPEAFPRTYQPDNEGLELEEIAGGVILRRPTEPASGIAKEVVIRLATDRAALTIDHHLINNSPWPIELAPWAITQFRPGGHAIIPFGPIDPDRAALLPNRMLVFWPYTQPSDPRFRFGDAYLIIHAGELPPTKLGTFVERGWTAYHVDETLIVKRFTPQPGSNHVDHGCNVEVYTDRNTLELETIAPLSRLEPGARVNHREEWELSKGTADPIDESWVQRITDGLNLP